MEWLDLAENLPVGHSTRLNCECGSGKTLIVNNNIKGYSCHCFRCDFNGFEGKGTQTLAEIARINELNEEAKRIELPLELPDDYTQDIPLHGRMWLYQGGITESVWRESKIGYSQKLDRVILPVYNDGKLVWYQCRALQKGQKPKYIQPSRGRESVLYKAGWNEQYTRVVIVEDILSAIRVGKHIPTASLLGTKITTSQAAQLSKFDCVTIWLDPDLAGKQGTNKIRRTLGLVTDVETVRTTADPKELNDQDIKEALCLLKH